MTRATKAGAELPFAPDLEATISRRRTCITNDRVSVALAEQGRAADIAWNISATAP